MNKLKYILVVLILPLMFINALDISFAANDDVVVSAIKSDKSDIDKGDKFNLTLTLKNSGTTPVTNVKISIESIANFQPTSGITITDATNALGVGATKDIPIGLKRVGDSNTLPIKLTWDDGGNSYDTTQTVIIAEAKDVDDDDDSSPANTLKYKPMLTVGSEDEIPIFTAGESAVLEIPVENLSRDTAKDVRVEITTEPDKLPFIIDRGSFSDKINYVRYTKEEHAKINVQVSPTAENKIYPINVKFTYSNIYRDESSSTGTYYVKVVNHDTEPTVGITKFKMNNDVLFAGKSDGILFTVENRGSIPAYNVKVTLSGFDKDGIRLFDDINSKSIESIGGSEESSLMYSIEAAPKAKSGAYQLDAKIEYTDEQGKKYENISNVYVQVEGKDSSAIELNVKNIKHAKTIHAGDKFNLSFDIENITKIDAEKVMVSIKYPNSFIPTSSPKKIIRNLKKDENKSLSFDFKAKQDIKTEYYDFFIVLDYYADSSSEEHSSFEEYAGVMVEGTSSLGRPKIIVQNYAIEGEQVAMAGKEFTLNVDLYNTSSDDEIKNIKVTMESDDGVFSPVDSSSSFFIKSLGRQESQSIPLKFKTKMDASVKVYNLVLTMEYEDGKGNAYDSQEQAYKEIEKLGIQVSQPIRLEISEPNIPMDVSVGMPSDIELEFFNMGKSTMYNMMVKLEGDFQVQGSNYFVGNFDSGRSEYFSSTIVPDSEGDKTGKILFEYEDALGNIQKDEKEFTLFVQSENSFDGMDGMEDMDGMGDGFENGGGFDFAPDENKPPAQVKKIAMILGFIAFVFVVVFLMKKRRNKNSMMEDYNE